jgi:hypothetical protein
MKKTKTVSKSVVKKPEVNKQEKVFLAYDADTGILVEGFRSLEALKADWFVKSSSDAELAWVAVETDITSVYTLQNRMELKKV